MIAGKLVRYRNSSGLILIPIRGTVRWEKPCLRWTVRTTKASGCSSGDSDYEEKPRVRTNDSSGDVSSDDMDGDKSDRVSSQRLAGVSVDADSAVVELSQGEIAHIEKSEHTALVQIFKDNNPEWDQIRVVATNKAVHDKDVLREMVPDALVTTIAQRRKVLQWMVKTEELHGDEKLFWKVVDQFPSIFKAKTLRSNVDKAGD
ncbi:hypothetical protein JG687_00015093 [Phytophthora cactorum]|uniref:ZSWIM1/3 RNaseH-like domain-containing protein n=1 Tax=Phytophthora cactorum TaxID=29920 RepID=A0A8T1TYY3_9STRA|nr:hypothetical protein JG687_00015093 [Phytophthora cactorum]